MMLQLIPNWKRCHRFLSTQMVVIDGAVAAGWHSVPDDLKAAIPSWASLGVAGALFVLTLAVRIIDQGPTTAAAPPTDPAP